MLVAERRCRRLIAVAGLRRRSKSWWTVATPARELGALSDPLLERALAVLLKLLQLRVAQAWKCVQLAVVTLHNASARSSALEGHCAQRGLCGSLLQIASAGAGGGPGGPCAAALIKLDSTIHVSH
jgi:hypothetical protein